MANRYLVSTGTWAISGGSMGATLIKNNAATTINAQTSRVILNLPSGSWVMGNTSFGLQLNDVRFNLGTNSGSVSLSIGGASTYRLLDIRSLNADDHTVNFTPDATITMDKFICIGASTTERIFLGTGDVDGAFLEINGSCYGENVNIVRVNNTGDAPGYLGTSSVNPNSRDGWILTAPDKISTFVDPLTDVAESNTNWVTEGNIVELTAGLGSGGYELIGAISPP